MKDIIINFDFLYPKVKIEHKGELFRESIISSIISIASLALIISLTIYFFVPFFKREEPITNIYHSYIIENGTFSISPSTLPNYIYMNNYNFSDFKLGFDFTTLRIIGMEFNLNIYTGIYEKDIKKFDHWLYGYCEPDHDILIKNEIEREIIKEAACIKKYYSSFDKKYYDIKDKKFRWPEITYGSLNANNQIYSLVVEKCEENTLKILFGEDIHCKNDLEIKNILDKGQWIYFCLYDNYIDLLDYKSPNNSYLYYLENNINNNYLSINNLHFSPITFTSDNGIIFSKKKKQLLYEFETNDLSIQKVHERDNNIYLNYNIIFNNKMTYYERIYRKLQNICSEIGGIIKIITFLGEIIIYYYNEYIVLKHTKQIIYLLHNKSNLETNEKTTNIQNDDFFNEIKSKNEKEIENNKKMKKELDNNKKIKIKKIIDDKKIYKIIQNSSMAINEKEDKENNEDKESMEYKETSGDKGEINDSKDFNVNLFNYLLFKLTFEKTFTKYKIYRSFRDKILCDEQIIKNHICLYNLKHRNDPTNRIYNLKEIINN